MIVIDASAMVAWLLNEPGELSIRELNVLLARHEIAVPAHWPSEIGNALVTNRRRGRVSNRDLDRMLTELSRFQIAAEPPPSGNDFATAIEFAFKHELTFYGAAYVKLALDMRAVLATLDGDMRRVALQQGVPVVP